MARGATLALDVYVSHPVARTGAIVAFAGPAQGNDSECAVQVDFPLSYRGQDLRDLVRREIVLTTVQRENFDEPTRLQV